MHYASAVISSLGRWPALGERAGVVGALERLVSSDTVDVVEFNNEGALMTAIMSQESMA